MNLKPVVDGLAKKGITVDFASFRSNAKQGAINRVYAMNSSAGKLIVHVGNHPDEKEQQYKAKRICAVSCFLKEHAVPGMDVLLCAEVDKKPVTVYRYIPGRRLAGVWFKKKYLKSLARILFALHQIDVPGFGHFTGTRKKLGGPQKDWLRYLEEAAFHCLENIYKSRRKKGQLSKEKYEAFRAKLKHFFKKHEKDMRIGQGKLVHGDIVLTNILVRSGRIAALIDWEWSFAGDPAWEFAGFACGGSRHEKSYQFVLKEYASLHKSFDMENFMLRVRLYWVIKILFIGNTFRNLDNWLWTVKQFEREIDGFLHKKR